MKNTDKGKLITIIGIAAMIIMVITRILMAPQIAEYSLLVGLACFFIVEAVNKTPDSQSGLRFKTVLEDLKKPGVLFWVLLPVVSAVGSIFIEKLLFDNQYAEHVIGRTASILNYDNIPLLIVELMIGALGEEIAFRGFFLGKGMKVFPTWLCMVVSSAVFALAHLAAGNPAVVAYDLLGIFIDALIYSMIYLKSGNCLLSAIGHFLCNVAGLAVTFAFFM